MKKSINKKKKDIDGKPDVLALVDLERFLRWKATQLTLLGYKLYACTETLKKYISFPNAKEVLKDVTEYYASLIKLIENFPQDTGLSEEEAKEFIFYLSPTNDDKIPVTIVAEKKAIGHKVGIGIQEQLNRIEEILKTIKIRERQSLTDLSQSCIMLGSHYLIEKNIQKKDMRQFARLEHDLRDTSCEALGYWTAKLEIMKQNKDNVKTRTNKKEERKAELKEWMKTMKPKQYRLKAMQKWEVSERTVLNYIQEIEDEKTAIMRKKDDTA